MMRQKLSTEREDNKGMEAEHEYRECLERGLYLREEEEGHMRPKEIMVLPQMALHGQGKCICVACEGERGD